MHWGEEGLGDGEGDAATIFGGASELKKDHRQSRRRDHDAQTFGPSTDALRPWQTTKRSLERGRGKWVLVACAARSTCMKKGLEEEKISAEGCCCLHVAGPMHHRRMRVFVLRCGGWRCGVVQRCAG